MYIEEAFRNNLVRFRHENGLTQYELSELSGISHKYIYKLETGQANPTIKIIDILAKTLGVSPVSFFLNEDGEKINFDWFI